MAQPRIETARLRLRPYRPADLDALHALFTDPGVRRYLLDGEVVSRDWVAGEIRASMELFARRGGGQWALFPRGEHALIGFCGYRHFHRPPELQLLYGLVPARWNRGLASEAARAMIRYGFEEQGLDAVVASTDAPNAASIRVMEKVGMRFERRAVVGGLETVVYTLAREDFEPGDFPYSVVRG